jgi:hypothetical protein
MSHRAWRRSQKLAATVASIRLSGANKTQEIADALNTRRVRTISGRGRWWPGTVARLLQALRSAPPPAGDLSDARLTAFAERMRKRRIPPPAGRKRWSRAAARLALAPSADKRRAEAQKRAAESIGLAHTRLQADHADPYRPAMASSAARVLDGLLQRGLALQPAVRREVRDLLREARRGPPCDANPRPAWHRQITCDT